ncbi:MAG: GNAT family N-acetyltransferase [Gemmatimonadota bacterium]
MTEEDRVRRAVPEDLDEIVALWSHYIRSHRSNPAYRRVTPDGVRKRGNLFIEHITGDDSAVFVLERQDGGLDGMITCFVEENVPYFHPHKYARIQTPFVRPDARRKGNLKRLLAAAYRWAREKELTEIRLYTGADNALANAIAEELGFEAIEVVRRHRIDWSRPPEGQVDR